MQHECNTWVFCGSIPFWVRLWCCEDQETNPRNVAGLGAREQMLAWSFVCQALWMLLLLPTCCRGGFGAGELLSAASANDRANGTVHAGVNITTPCDEVLDAWCAEKCLPSSRAAIYIGSAGRPRCFDEQELLSSAGWVRDHGSGMRTAPSGTSRSAKRLCGEYSLTRLQGGRLKESGIFKSAEELGLLNLVRTNKSCRKDQKNVTRPVTSPARGPRAFMRTLPSHTAPFRMPPVPPFPPSMPPVPAPPGRPACAITPLPPLRYRADLGGLLRSMGLRGAAVELGTRDGKFTHVILSQWKQCALYVQVDAWRHLDNYMDRSNADVDVQGERRREAYRYLRQAMNAGHLRRGGQCANLTSVCARRFADGTFDFIFVDARHDRLGVLEDLQAWWPKLRRGGLMAGHDYTEQLEPRSFWVDLDRPMMSKFHADPERSHQNWTCASQPPTSAKHHIQTEASATSEPHSHVPLECASSSPHASPAPLTAHMR